MTSLIRRNNSNFFDPYRTADGLGGLDSFFDDFFTALSPTHMTPTMLSNTNPSLMDRIAKTTKQSNPVRVTTQDDHYTIAVAAPGLPKESFSINVREEASGHDVLTIGYTTDSDAGTTFTRGSFSRSWTLPVGTIAGDINAEYKDGVLTVNIQKIEPTTNEFNIEVK